MNSFLLLVLGALFAFPPLLYPYFLRLFRKRFAQPDGATDWVAPACSVLVVGRGAASLLERKLQNTLEVLEGIDCDRILIVADGPDQEMRAVADRFDDDRLYYLETRTWQGKNAAIRAALPLVSTELLVFTDVDALLDRNSFRELLLPFQDRAVGGVCGQRKLLKDGEAFERAQQNYIGFDSMIKVQETERMGSISSNDGKLYAVRRALIRTIQDGCTDDFSAGLEVREHGKRLVFAPRALAYIAKPSRSYRHEWTRRRRVVCRMLNSLYYHRSLLDVRQHPRYAVQLWMNKVARGTMFPGGMLMMAGLLGFMPQLVFLFFVGAVVGMLGLMAAGRKWVISTAFYAGFGMFASFAGVFDFTFGRRYRTWTPKKATTHQTLTQT